MGAAVGSGRSIGDLNGWLECGALCGAGVVRIAPCDAPLFRMRVAIRIAGWNALRPELECVATRSNRDSSRSWECVAVRAAGWNAFIALRLESLFGVRVAIRIALGNAPPSRAAATRIIDAMIRIDASNLRIDDSNLRIAKFENVALSPVGAGLPPVPRPAAGMDALVNAAT
jgi:hypothetical protein